MKKENIVIWLLPLAVFILTKNPITGPWRLILALLALLWVIIDNFWFLKGSEGENVSKRKLIDVVIFGLALVGATNWFFSPFFFILYLLAIAVTFEYDAGAGLGFIIALVLLFVFNVGEVDVAYDSLVLLSLLVTFPIALYLRKEYIKLQEGQKRILVLERESQDAKDTVSKLLANVVTNLTAEVRGPLVNIKNYSHAVLLKMPKAKKSKEKTYIERVYESALLALRMVNEFDEKSTGKTIKTEEEKEVKDKLLPSQEADQGSDRPLLNKF